MPKMIAIKKQQYGGKNISVGDKFDVSVHHTRLLKVLGRATNFVEVASPTPLLPSKPMQDVGVADMAAVKAMSTQSNPELVPTPARHAASEHVAQETPKAVEETEKVEETQHIVETSHSGEPSILDVISNVEEEPSPLEEIDEDESSDMSTSTPSPQQTSEYSAMLRNRARSLGIRVDGRWSDERVQREIDEYNKKTYQRMDIRASE